jgi:hypothetical protein
MAAGLPFTLEEFFEVFAAYNRALWPAVSAWWFASLAVVVAVWWNPARYTRSLTYLLAALWAWNALVYHAWLFTRINPAAWLFAALFAVQAGLFVSASPGLAFFAGKGWSKRLGELLVLYAFAYPSLTVAAGHRYPATPTFGVPCPTVILTIGLILTAPAVPLRLAIVPIAWGLVGGSAALLLNVSTDYVLLAAVMLLALALTRQAGSVA